MQQTLPRHSGAREPVSLPLLHLYSRNRYGNAVCKRYRIRFPEEAALLVISWLAERGDLRNATAIVSEVAPFAHRLKFLPEVAQTPLPEEQTVWRLTAGQAQKLLLHKRDNVGVETMNKTLSVWTPLKLEFATLWGSVITEGRVVTTFDAAWHGKAASLLLQYENAKAEHRLAKKGSSPRENLQILRSATEKVCAGTSLPNREIGRVIRAVCDVQAKHARGGYSEVALPTHASIAKGVAPHLARFDPELGIADPVSRIATLASTTSTQLPPSVKRILQRTTAATIDGARHDGSCAFRRSARKAEP